jgi:hypothetical protein
MHTYVIISHKLGKKGKFLRNQQKLLKNKNKKLLIVTIANVCVYICIYIYIYICIYTHTKDSGRQDFWVSVPKIFLSFEPNKNHNALCVPLREVVHPPLYMYIFTYAHVYIHVIGAAKKWRSIYIHGGKCEEKKKNLARSLKLEKGKIQIIMCTVETYTYLYIYI